MKLETFSVLKKFAKVCQCRKHARPCFEPVRTASVAQAQNRSSRKIESTVQACRRKHLTKRESARYTCCSGKGKLCRRSRKFCAKLRLGRTNTPRTGKNFRFIQIFSCSERRNFALSHQTSLFQKTAFCSHKNKFLPNAPFPETHNLLSTQIKVCLYINTHKSLRSKTAVSHRFKILRAILHKTVISNKIS